MSPDELKKFFRILALVTDISAQDFDQWYENIFKEDQSKVTSLPCPKCGNSNTKMIYKERCKDDCHPEGFRRSCSNCTYTWFTTDTLDKG